MPIEVVWDDEESAVARVDYVMPWGWDDYHSAMGKLTEMAVSSGRKINVIADFTRTPSLPSGALSQFSRTSSDTSRRAIVVIVGANRFIRLIGNALLKINPIGTRQIYFVKTPDEAREIIGKQALH